MKKSSRRLLAHQDCKMCRARIKEACDLMRQLVPGMSDKTDKATVFEFSARYIHFLKNFVGGHHDKVRFINCGIIYKINFEGCYVCRKFILLLSAAVSSQKQKITLK